MLKFGQGAPLRNRLVFVVTKRDFAARIALCAKFRRKKQRSFPKTYRLVGIHDRRKRHIEQKFDDVARFDLFLESDDTLVARHDFLPFTSTSRLVYCGTRKENLISGLPDTDSTTIFDLF